MKANEIRIGNYLNFTCSDPIKQVQVDKDYFLSQGFWRDLQDGCFKPILLNEEWLFKLGFNKHGMAYVNFSFIINKWTDGQLMYGYIGGNIEVKHVHQLQNLYFALTGEELKIKLK